MAVFKSLAYQKKVVGIAKIDNRLLAAEAWNVNFSVIKKWAWNKQIAKCRKGMPVCALFFCFLIVKACTLQQFSPPYKYSR